MTVNPQRGPNKDPWSYAWETKQTQNELAALQLQYIILNRYPCSLILVDRSTHSLHQYFPQQKLEHVEAKYHPCTHSTRYVWALFLPSLFLLRKHPFRCPSLGVDINRIHLACVYCRIRRVINGALPRLNRIG